MPTINSRFYGKNGVAKSINPSFTPVTFWCAGDPRPQGSKTPYTFKRKDGSTGVSLTETAKGLKAWRTDVKAAAIQVWNQPVIVGEAITLKLTFLFLRPISVSAKKRPYPIVTPDLDKLIRAVGDALSGVVYKADSQIIDLTTYKRYGTNLGVWVEIAPVGMMSKEIDQRLASLIEPPTPTPTIESKETP